MSARKKPARRTAVVDVSAPTVIRQAVETADRILALASAEVLQTMHDLGQLNGHHVLDLLARVQGAKRELALAAKRLPEVRS